MTTTVTVERIVSFVSFWLVGLWLVIAGLLAVSIVACERVDPKTAEALTEGAVELVDAVCEETEPENGLARFFCAAVDIADDVLSKTAAGSTSAIASGTTRPGAPDITPTAAPSAPGTTRARGVVVRVRPEAVASFCRTNRCTFKPTEPDP